MKPTPDWLLFLGKFLRQGTAVAACVPSSRWLAGALVRDIAPDARVVELGAGTGAVTAQLLQRTRRPIIVERDPDFCRRLRQRFPHADIAECDALDLERILDERGIDQLDHVLSGLPLPSFPPPARDRLMHSVARRLAPAGSFRQLTLMPWVYAGLYRSYFGEVRFQLVPLNVPPGGVYVCRRSLAATR